MHLKYNNVNDAFLGLVKGIDSGEIPTTRTSSRNGDVLVIEEPVIVTYEKPLQRVLFNLARDCNCFFHLYESLWMLAGRNDVESLAYYNSQMRQFSDDFETLNGAYGYRWRLGTRWHVESKLDSPKVFRYVASDDVDQLKILIGHLKENPNSRRAVLQMWNVEDDLLKIDSSKDVCCNTHIYFSIRKICYEVDTGGVNPDGSFITGGEEVRFLDMTVCNRSNDMILGLLGANVVHFSFLQEYMANAIGVEVGVYNQFTNNLHVYVDKWEPAKWLQGYDPKIRTQHDDPIIDYASIMQDDKHEFVKFDTNDEEVIEFVEINKNGEDVTYTWKSEFLNSVAQPICAAFHCHKNRNYEETNFYLNQIVSPDWFTVAKNWITKRRISWEKKNVS